MSSVAANSKVLGLDNVLDEWTGFPRIKERNAAALCPWLGVEENILDVDTKVDRVIMEDAHVSRLDWNAILNVVGHQQELH